MPTSLPVAQLPSLGRPVSDFGALWPMLVAAGHEVLPIEPPTAVAAGSTLHDLAAIVIAHLDAAGAERVHLVGHAFGQRLARCVAADAPHRVATLTLLACGGYVPMAPDVEHSLLACFDPTLPPDEHLDHVRRVFFAPGNDPAMWTDGWMAGVATYQSAAVRATPRDDWWDATAERVLVVQGLQDVCAVPENGRRYVADHADVATLVEIDGAGHALLPEQPAAIAAALVPFLDG